MCNHGNDAVHEVCVSGVVEKEDEAIFQAECDSFVERVKHPVMPLPRKSIWSWLRDSND